MIKTLSDLEKALKLLVAHNIIEATLQVTISNERMWSNDEKCHVLTSKTMPITLKFSPNRPQLDITDQFKPNDSNDMDTDDDILFHSTE